MGDLIHHLQSLLPAYGSHGDWVVLLILGIGSIAMASLQLICAWGMHRRGQRYASRMFLLFSVMLLLLGANAFVLRLGPDFLNVASLVLVLMGVLCIPFVIMGRLACKEYLKMKEAQREISMKLESQQHAGAWPPAAK
jgi:hypothetical protein